MDEGVLFAVKLANWFYDRGGLGIALLISLIGLAASMIGNFMFLKIVLRILPQMKRTNEVLKEGKDVEE